MKFVHEIVVLILKHVKVLQMYKKLTFCGYINSHQEWNLPFKLHWLQYNTYNLKLFSKD